MIDEKIRKRFESFEKWDTELFEAFVKEAESDMDDIEPHEKLMAKEFIRLARLGLWAEKHGAPTIRFLSENIEHDSTETGVHVFSDWCLLCALVQALAALPKKSKK